MPRIGNLPTAFTNRYMGNIDRQRAEQQIIQERQQMVQGAAAFLQQLPPGSLPEGFDPNALTQYNTPLYTQYGIAGADRVHREQAEEAERLRLEQANKEDQISKGNNARNVAFTTFTEQHDLINSLPPETWYTEFGRSETWKMLEDVKTGRISRQDFIERQNIIRSNAMDDFRTEQGIRLDTDKEFYDYRMDADEKKRVAALGPKTYSDKQVENLIANMNHIIQTKPESFEEYMMRDDVVGLTTAIEDFDTELDAYIKTLYFTGMEKMHNPDIFGVDVTTGTGDTVSGKVGEAFRERGVIGGIGAMAEPFRETRKATFEAATGTFEALFPQLAEAEKKAVLKSIQIAQKAIRSLVGIEQEGNRQISIKAVRNRLNDDGKRVFDAFFEGNLSGIANKDTIGAANRFNRYVNPNAAPVDSTKIKYDRIP